MDFLVKTMRIIFLLIFVILIFLIIIPFVFSGFKISIPLMIFQGLFKDFYTLEILDASFEISALILLVGIPSIIINHFSKIFPRNVNFMALPAISLLLVFVFGMAHMIIFIDTSDMKGLASAIYMVASFIFLIIFSMVISFTRLYRKR